MKNNRTIKRPMPFNLMSEQSTIITDTDKQTEEASKKISLITIVLLCIALVLMTGCANYGSARTGSSEKLAANPVYIVTEAGNQCAALNKEIADILEYNKKFKHSQYASHYQAMTREKLFAIEPRAKEAHCTFSSRPANTRLHQLASN